MRCGSKLIFVLALDHISHAVTWSCCANNQGAQAVGSSEDVSTNRELQSDFGVAHIDSMYFTPRNLNPMSASQQPMSTYVPNSATRQSDIQSDVATYPYSTSSTTIKPTTSPTSSIPTPNPMSSRTTTKSPTTNNATRQSDIQSDVATYPPYSNFNYNQTDH